MIDDNELNYVGNLRCSITTMAFKKMTVYRIKTFLALMSHISDREMKELDRWRFNMVKRLWKNVLHQDGKFFVDIDKFGHCVIDG